jgi:hypothetical protein
LYSFLDDPNAISTRITGSRPLCESTCLPEWATPWIIILIERNHHGRSYGSSYQCLAWRWAVISAQAFRSLSGSPTGMLPEQHAFRTVLHELLDGSHCRVCHRSCPVSMSFRQKSGDTIPISIGNKYCVPQFPPIPSPPPIPVSPDSPCPPIPLLVEASVGWTSESVRCDMDGPGGPSYARLTNRFPGKTCA